MGTRRLIPEDISAFVFCPYLQQTHKQESRLDRLSLFEQCIVETIQKTEQDCLLQNSDITPRKLLRRWDNIWWPITAKNKIDFKYSQTISISASNIFSDYCKYDISGYMYPTIGIGIESTLDLGHHILFAQADILKVNLTIKNKNIVILNFCNTKSITNEIVVDQGIQSVICSFAKNILPDGTINYTNVYINKNTSKLDITTAVFRQNDIDKIYKNIKYIEEGIYKGINYMNKWNCKECNKCQKFRL
jgi:hypothetical protein